MHPGLKQIAAELERQTQEPRRRWRLAWACVPQGADPLDDAPVLQARQRLQARSTV